MCKNTHTDFKATNKHNGNYNEMFLIKIIFFSAAVGWLVVQLDSMLEVPGFILDEVLEFCTNNSPTHNIHSSRYWPYTLIQLKKR